MDDLDLVIYNFRFFISLLVFAVDTGCRISRKNPHPKNDRNVVPLTEFLDCSHNGNAAFFALWGHQPLTIFELYFTNDFSFKYESIS